MASTLEDLHAAADDGRCLNVHFRQQQLKALHDVLRKNVDRLRDALRHDTHITDEEASIEVALSLSTVKNSYDSLDPEKDLEEEYRIAKGRDAADRMQPWGVVYIDPELRHTPLFSLVAPLSAALAAGNCVAVKLENSLKALPSLLRTILPEALDFDILLILTSTPAETSLRNCVSVLQDADIDSPTCSQLVSKKANVIAVVDRTADLAAAAEQLVIARFAFGGRSPYAPDLILVNEWSKVEFLELVLRHAVRFLASSTEANNGSIDESLQRLQKSKRWKMSTITKGDKGAVVELINTSTKHLSLPAKMSEPILCISAITSLDHAVDLISSNLPDSYLSSAYHFAAPTHAKYLAQFVKSDVSFVNHIPLSLLLGPTTPRFQAFNLDSRYTPAHFQRASPQYIKPPSSQTNLIETLSTDRSKVSCTKLLSASTTEIQPRKRPDSIAVGFFEQGILIGLAVYGIPLATCLGASLFYLSRTAIRRYT
ncbi:ALDH-like protein [Polyplosphaeria fusca]|uniref:ALDH-like protein n=1 Tax=Polyplosphaeria fusca TaxID=682080 RepID=A0A9P4UTR2_9PLEO|nr:ALDH-like protein [Polyplosphaeria fusca]